MPPLILLDTNAVVFDALQPDRLSRAARKKIEQGQTSAGLACSDISLWEIAMLISKDRLDPGVPALEFLNLALAARSIEVLPIGPEIADLSASFGSKLKLDPADRLIAATALHHRATLITTDRNLKRASLPITILS
jgi:PIN domain nuclease of toxin-antitoxin system